MPRARFALNCAGCNALTACSALCSSTPQRASLVVHSLATWWTARMGIHHVKSHCAARPSRICARRTAARSAKRLGAKSTSLCIAPHSIVPASPRRCRQKRTVVAPPQQVFKGHPIARPLFPAFLVALQEFVLWHRVMPCTRAACLATAWCTACSIKPRPGAASPWGPSKA